VELVAGTSKSLGVRQGDYPVELTGQSLLGTEPADLKKKIEAAVQEGDTEVTFYRRGAVQAELDEKYPKPKAPPPPTEEEASARERNELFGAPVVGSADSSSETAQAFSRTQSLLTENTKQLDKRGQQIERNAEDAEQLAAGTSTFEARAKRIAEISKNSWW